MHKIKGIIDYIIRVREKGRNFNRSGLYIAFALISAYALIMSAVCFIGADVIMGIANAVIGMFMILTIIVFAKIKSGRTLSVFVVISLYALMVFFLYEGGVGGVSVMWLLFVPMGAMALISLYYGAILSILLGVTVPLYMLTPLHLMGYQYTEEMRIRFPIIYWAFVILAFVVFVRIDRAEEAQNELIERANESNRLKSEFLATMSHEIRTPMNAIMGMCELTMNEDISEIVRENNENIYHSGKNLMNIINDLLDFSKIESGKMELSCSQDKLSEILDDVIYMIVARKGGKKLEFVVECDPDVPNILYGDEVRLKQIMINILTNALKYTQEGGFLMKVSSRRESYGINLVISVRDSGIGIKKESMYKVFDAYGRVDEEKNRKIEGTGLGLPITKKLIKLMNGVICVRSEYGKGTEFKVVIPQKVIDYTPIVSFDIPENTNLLYYSVGDKLPEFAEMAFMNSFKKILNKRIKGYICSNLNDVKREIRIKNYTHIIVGKKEYLEDKNYFDELSKTRFVAVIRERAEYMELGENIVNIFKPFYTAKLCDVLNKHHSKNINLNIPEEFTAPGASVLVVDDNLVNLKVAKGHMKPYKVTVDTATDGPEAIEMIKQKKYDLVFMDHLMPGMDGIETHREIRLIQKDYAEKIPVIALTANAVSDVRDLFITEGFQDFISKPIQTEILKSVLLKWLPDSLIIRKKEGNDE